MKSASVDLTGESKHYAGGIYIGGTHPAASGGAYMTAIFGFAGIHLHDSITVDQQLPPSFQSMQFHLLYKQKRYLVHITRQHVDIREVLS
jgi:trehalose/maltose hydrolase-like predicted phosphorylase